MDPNRASRLKTKPSTTYSKILPELEPGIWSHDRVMIDSMETITFATSDSPIGKLTCRCARFEGVPGAFRSNQTSRCGLRWPLGTRTRRSSRATIRAGLSAVLTELLRGGY